MAHIVIDGYNLLPVTTYPDRDKLVAALARYKKEKGHDVTIVFDGTYDGTGTGDRSFSAGIEILFSPLTFTADDIIEKLVLKLDPNSMIVVSSDRRIQKAAKRAGAVVLESKEFAKRLSQSSSLMEMEQGDTPPWMEGRADEEENDRPRPKKGTAHKLSKEARRKKRSMKKL